MIGFSNAWQSFIAPHEWLPLVLCLTTLAAWSRSDEPSLERFEYVAPTMGTMLKIVLYSESQARAEEAIDAALNAIERLIPVLNNYDPESEISQLSQTIQSPQTLSPDLSVVVRQAARWHTLSKGKFDITIGPLTQLWSQARRNQKLPDPVAIESVHGRIGWNNLRVTPVPYDATDPLEIELLADGMRIDVSGLATGYIIDRAFEAIVDAGHDCALIDIGGDIRMGVSPPGTDGWTIDVGGIRRDAPPLRQLRLHSCAVTASGDLNQFIEIDGRRYSHLMDPIGQQPIERRQSTTVVAATALDADVGATTLCVMGMDEASRAFDSLPITQAILLEIDPQLTQDCLPAIRYRNLVHDQ